MNLRVALPDLVSPSYFPVIAAVELGLFHKEGVEASIQLCYPVTKSFELLARGEVDLVAGSAHAALYEFKEWKGCRLLCALSQNMYWFLVVRSDMRTVKGDLKQLKGLRIAAAPGPVDGLRRMLSEQGLPPDHLQIVPVPTSTAGISFGVSAAAALESGEIDGFWANGMGAEVAVRNGTGIVVIDARRGDGPPGATHYTFAALVATEDRIASDPELISVAVRALVGAQHELRRDPSLAAIAATPHFPPAERGLITELVVRDLPFYDAIITSAKVDELNKFAIDIGILENSVPFEKVVATEFSSFWNHEGYLETSTSSVTHETE